MKSQNLAIIFILMPIFMSACSGGGKSPISTEAISPDLPDSLVTPVGETNRNVLAVYDAVIDPEAGTFTVTPDERTGTYHFPLTQFYPNVLTITGYGFTPNFWADIKITHPLPFSDIDGFDPRVIAILSANPGVSMNYPIFNVVANNSVVLNPDGYTKLYDSLRGSIPGNTNPFLAYFKHVGHRRWFSNGTGFASDTRRWEMDIDGFGGPMQFKLIVDVSTNYPNLPTPVIDNAPEPVQIDTFIDQGLPFNGGSVNIEVTFLDWQGANDIKCKIEAPSLFTGVVQLFYSGPGQNPHEYIFSGTIANNLLAPQGDYPILIAAWDVPSDIHVFQEKIVTVSDETGFNPVDITPPWLNFRPFDVQVEGNYAYVAGSVNGLHIFNISNPLNPVWVNWVDIQSLEIVSVSGGYAYGMCMGDLNIIDIEPPESAYIVKTVYISLSAREVYLSGGYAYIPDSDSHLQIIDIDPPESAYSVKKVETNGFINEINISDGYAYVAEEVLGHQSCLQIIDTDPPESAYIVKTVGASGEAYGVYVSGGYAYVAGSYAGLQIIDIEPPESAYIVKTVDTPGEARRVQVSGGYAYVADSFAGFHIIDIEPPESAYIVKTVDTPSYSVHVSGGYAYVKGGNSLNIIDIDPPELAYIVKAVSMSGYVLSVCISSGYAYVVGASLGLQIIDIDPPESAYIVKSVETSSSARSVHLSSGYAYVADVDLGLQIIDIDQLEFANIVKTIDTPGEAFGVYVIGDYAFIADSYAGLQIIEINPPEAAYIVKTVDTPGRALEIYISGGYAYIADRESGLQIIDIEPPEAAYIVKSVETWGNALGIYVSGGYAYVGEADANFQIIDIEPLQSAHIVKTVDIPLDAYGVHVSSGYAYVADGYSGLQIIDIEPPDSAYIVKTVDTLDATEVYVSGGYAYVADYGSLNGIKIIDINPPESAYIVKTIDSVTSAVDIDIIDGYVYVAADICGLRIIKLW